MSTDPRKRRVSITLTAEEWDSVASFDVIEDSQMSSYAERLRSDTTHKIGRAVGPPAERYQRALAEVEATRPIVLPNLPRIREAIKAYVSWFYAGDYRGVSHLGAGNPTDSRWREPVPGLYLSMTPTGVLVIRLRELKFTGEYPYFRFDQREFESILAACREIGTVADHWNGWTEQYGGGSSFSVKFSRAYAGEDES